MTRLPLTGAGSKIRPRINQRLFEAAAFPLTVIVAPAGFGKTTAIRGFLEQAQLSIFVSTPNNATLETFVHAFNDACRVQLSNIEGPPRPLTVSNSSGNLDLYVPWANANLRGSFCTIAIDDLQNADGDPHVATFLIELARLTQDHVKWIISSRTRGHLPIARWQAYGETDTLITSDDLRITFDEAMSIAKTLSSPATPDQVRTWVDLTRGFPVPLVYAMRLSSKHGHADDILDSTRSFTFDYLADQLWALLSDDEQAILETAAFLPPLHIHAYESAGIPHASAILSRLCDGIAFLSLSHTNTFSMHDLFREFAKRQVTLKGPSAFHARYRRAVEILIRDQRYGDTVDLINAHSTPHSVAETVESFASAISDHSVIQRIVDATGQLPLESLGLETLCIQLEHWSWFDERHKARRNAEEILRRPAATSKHLLSALLSIFRIIDSQTETEQREWLANVPRIIARLTVNDAVQAYACQAALLARLPAMQAEATRLIKAVLQNAKGLLPVAQIDVQMALTSAFYYLGERDAALAASRAAAEIAEELGDTRAIARTLNSLGLMLVNTYDPEVETLFTPLKEAIERTGSWRFCQTSHWLQALYYAWKGDYDAGSAAHAFLSIIPAEAAQRPRLRNVQRLSINLCRLINADYDAIISDFGLHGLPKDRTFAYEIAATVSMAYAIKRNTVLLENMLSELRKLRQAILASQGLNRQTVFIEVIALCAAGQWPQARRLNEQELKAADNLRPLEMVIERLCLGPPFIGISQLLDNCMEKPFMGLIALLVRRVVESDWRGQSSLTPAELMILSLISAGKSNKDIAAIRTRSAETIKRQVASLLRKLGAESRTSAIAIARERGILN